MIFYITGPDHSGKSTLANKLVRERKANYIHSTYDKSWNMEDYHSKIGQMALDLNSFKQDIVLDRWCLDAYPYRFVNKGNTYNPIELWNNFVELAGNDLILIYCLPANEFNPIEREEMFTSEEMVTVEREFNKLFSNINHYKYYYKTDGSEMLKFIDKCIELQKIHPLNYEWKEKIEFVNYGYEFEMKEFLKQEKELEEISEEEFNKAMEKAREEVDKKYKEERKNKTKRKGKHFLEDSVSPEPLNDLDAIGFDRYLKEYYKSQAEAEKKADKQVDEKSFDYSKLPKCICVDFDGTLSLNAKFPACGDLNVKLVNELFNGKYKDYKKILFTNRTGQALEDAVKWCNDQGIVWDAINDNVQEVKDMGLSPRKVWFDILIDDKAINVKDI